MSNIGVDIDGVLMDVETFVIENGARFGAKFGMGAVVDPNGYTMADLFGWTKDKDLEFWHEHIWKYVSVPPMKDCKKYLQKLHDEGNKIIIITNRWLSGLENADGEKMRKTVKDWFKKHAIPHDAIVFAKGDKPKFVKQYKIDLMIEDGADEIAVISPIVPVIVFDAPYNHAVTGKNIFRAKTWREIYDLTNAQKRCTIQS